MATWVVDVINGNTVTFYAENIKGIACVSGGTYQWKRKRSGTTTNVGNSNSYTYTPSDNDEIWCEITSKCDCITGNPATSRHIFVNIISIPVTKSVMITASNNILTFCSDTSITFTAHPSNFTSPNYVWKKLNGFTITTLQNCSTTSTLTYNSFATGDYIYCECGTGNCTTDKQTSNSFGPYTITANVIPAVTLEITTGTNPCCAETPIRIHANVTRGIGNGPTYAWYINGTLDATETTQYYKAAGTFIPTNGQTIQCRVTLTTGCHSSTPVNSDTITMTVNAAVTPSVSITCTEPICISPILNALYFTATPTNGGTAPTYVWWLYWNGSWTSVNTYYDNTFSYGPYDTTTINVYCVMTSNSTNCVTNNNYVSTSNTIIINKCCIEWMKNAGGTEQTHWTGATSGIAAGWSLYDTTNQHRLYPAVKNDGGLGGIFFSGYYQQMTSYLEPDSSGGFLSNSIAGIGAEIFNISFRFQFQSYASNYIVMGIYLRKNDGTLILLDYITYVGNENSSDSGTYGTTYDNTSTAYSFTNLVIICSRAANTGDGDYFTTMNIDEVTLTVC